ncbi:MAG TPA: hypothetical protein VHK69_18175 [Chitinophagaceae bacterium]|jgi:hypothetical protein|nr:hypothetical protein [Chitinophagaceae bacterium]
MKNDFSEGEILETIRKVGKLENTGIQAEEMMHDILDAVCLLQKDGLKYVFSHRSFQEYFTAYSLARLPEEKVSALIKRFSERTADNVIPMLFDMNSNLVVRVFLNEALKDYVKSTSHIDPKSFDIIEFLKCLKMDLFIQYLSKDGHDPVIIVSPFFPRSVLGIVRDIALRLYPECRGNYDPTVQATDGKTYNSKIDAVNFRDDIVSMVSGHMPGPTATFIYQDGAIKMSRRSKKQKGRTLEIADVSTAARVASFNRWLAQSELKSFMGTEHHAPVKLSTRIQREMLQKEKTMAEILDL